MLKKCKRQELALEEKGYTIVDTLRLPDIGHLFGRMIHADDESLFFFMNRCELGSLYYEIKYGPNSSLSLSDIEINIGDKIYSSTDVSFGSLYYCLVQEKLLLEEDKAGEAGIVRDIIENIVIFVLT